ncbi:hypothetical protein [Streptomyces sp. NPDC086989]|uniref:hypothetical protein n=1 Tax=Streptomyces sp. NPDC086989 TaxID=3365764 RepID=UPI0038146618
MDMRTTIETLITEAREQIRDQAWIPTPTDRAIAGKAAVDLANAIGTAHAQSALPPVERLEQLRAALAALAISLAHVHGRLAWFLGATATALTPVLQWRALNPEGGPAFGTVQPTPEQYTDAEEAIRRIQTTLTHIAAP